jgi:hypothetical protein
MAVCSNCKKTLSCGCQKRKASNGASVCTNCISAYEKKNNLISRSTAPTLQSIPPTVWTEDQISESLTKLNVWKNNLKR